MNSISLDVYLTSADAGAVSYIRIATVLTYTTYRYINPAGLTADRIFSLDWQELVRLIILSR